MKFGLFTSGYQRFDLEKAFIDAKKFSYDYIELWGARPHAYPLDFDICVDEINRLIKKYDMPVKVYTPEINAYPYNIMWENEKMRQDSIELLYKAMDFAKAIGAEYTLISAGHSGYNATDKQIKERLKDSLEKILAYAKKIDHKIIYEALTTFESNVTNTANEMAELIDEIDDSNLFGMNDIIVPYIQGENIMNYLDKLGDKMVHMHIVDSGGVSESHVCPGLGVLPLKELMAELKDYGYDGNITIELVTNYLNEPSIYSKIAINNLKEYL